VRKAIQSGYADFIPVFLSDIPDLFRSGLIRLDAALLHLSPPDRQGYCSLGTSVDVARAAADSAPLLIAEVNRQMPRTHGDSSVPLKSLTAYTQTDCPLHEHPASEETPVEAAIGEQIAKLIEDGATIQTGIGSIPDAVLSRLTSKHDLGIHTEMFSDRVLDLVDAGVVTNRCKKVYPGRIVTSFVTGSRRLFDFIDDNPLVTFLPSDITSPPDRPHGAGLRRFSWTSDLLGNRGADGLYPRSCQIAGGPCDYRLAVDCQGGHVVTYLR
jgi:acyl-CoA hydrolase